MICISNPSAPHNQEFRETKEGRDDVANSRRVLVSERFESSSLFMEKIVWDSKLQGTLCNMAWVL